MHEYDVALKRILTRPNSAVLTALTGSSSLRWLNVETPLVRNLRVDLLGESPAGELIHIELQSRNDATFPMRMGQYSFAVGLRYGRLPRQIALYVGAERLRMKNQIAGPGGVFRFDLVDVRELDGDLLLASENLGDNVIAILTGLGSESDAVKRVLGRIAHSPPEARDEALVELSLVAGLRKMGGTVRREVSRMPIQEDIRDHDYLGPLIKQREIAILSLQIEKRFGAISPKVRKRLDALSPDQIDALALRLLEAHRIEDLFAQQ